MNKKADLTFSPLVYAILALVILAVCIGVFYALTKGPLAGIFGIGEQTQDSSDDTLDELTITLGTCEPPDQKCWIGKEYICNSAHKWEETDDTC